MTANATVVIRITFDAWLRRGGHNIGSCRRRDGVAVCTIQLGDGLAVVFVLETRVFTRSATRRRRLRLAHSGTAARRGLLRPASLLLRLCRRRRCSQVEKGKRKERAQEYAEAKQSASRLAFQLFALLQGLPTFSRDCSAGLLPGRFLINRARGRRRLDVDFPGDKKVLSRFFRWNVGEKNGRYVERLLFISPWSFDSNGAGLPD